MSSDSRQQVWDVYAKAMEVFDKKNADYGDAWRTNGWRGNLSRIFEKTQRVRNLAWRADPRVPAVGDEQVLETLQDMLNTIAFAIINMIDEVEYGHEVPRRERLGQMGHDYTPGEATTFYDQVAQELPHRTPKPVDQVHTAQELSLLADHELSEEQAATTDVATAFVPRDVMADALATSLTHGPDEMRPAEQEGTGQKPRRGRPVRDNPQA